MSESPAHPGIPWLVATGLHKRYIVGDRTLEVLQGVDLAVDAGEFVALRGASGAGKSTLLHLLGGVDVPDAGEITVGGLRLTGMGYSALARFRSRRVGFVFQAYHLLPDLTALENVMVPARLARVGPGEAESRARRLLDRVGLSGRIGHRPNQLSGGEQQRVAIARCLINEPDLILADEPTGNLDTRTGDGVLELLLDLRAERGTTMIVATHDPRIAARAGRQVVMRDGVVAAAGVEG